VFTRGDRRRRDYRGDRLPVVNTRGDCRDDDRLFGLGDRRCDSCFVYSLLATGRRDYRRDQLSENLRTWMTFKISDNQYGQLHPSDSWNSCYVLRCVCSLLCVRCFGWKHALALSGAIKSNHARFCRNCIKYSSFKKIFSHIVCSEFCNRRSLKITSYPNALLHYYVVKYSYL